jgi:endonuclease/exonuclease/phosphatase family metal-dependent hydrolase
MQIRILTYNIKSGRNQPEGLEAVARIVEECSPDVLGLQEVDEGMARTQGVAQTDWLSRRLHMRGFYAPAMAYDGGQYGVALLTCWAIMAHQRHPLYRPDYPDAGSRPRHDGEPRVMLGVRLSPSDAGGAGGHAPASTSRSLNVIVTHLGLTPDQRLIQVREVADFAREWGGPQPTVVLGDFNCNPDAPELAPLRSILVDACGACGVSGDDRRTFRPGAPGAPAANEVPAAIDYVWVSPGVRITAARVVMDETWASDHRPLLVDLEL